MDGAEHRLVTFGEDPEIDRLIRKYGYRGASHTLQMVRKNPELARNLAFKGANLMITITNDAWFGKTSAPYQHFSMAVFRAIENRGFSRWICRHKFLKQKDSGLLFQKRFRMKRIPIQAR